MIHIILQGKGGVGKSLVASILAQYFHARQKDNVYCADTDPVNDTFSRYKAFPVETVDIMDSADNIDERLFDKLIEKLLTHEGTAVIDNGASTFVPLTSYLVDSKIPEMLKDNGKDVVIHCVITGGQALQDTLVGLQTLINTQSAPLIVWENEYFGDINKDGKSFTESNLYLKNKERILGVVKIAQRNEKTYGKDMEILASNMLTFDEAQTSSLFTIIPRSRLQTIKKDIYSQLDALNLQ